MSVLWGTLVVLVAIVWLVTIWDLVSRHLGRQRTLAWVLLVLILPIVGAGIYWVLREREAGEHRTVRGPPPS